jgi:hypothetical protein
VKKLSQYLNVVWKCLFVLILIRLWVRRWWWRRAGQDGRSIFQAGAERCRSSQQQKLLLEPLVESRDVGTRFAAPINGWLSHSVLEGKPNANHVRARIRTHVHSDYIIGHHHTMLELNSGKVFNYIKMSKTSTESNTLPLFNIIIKVRKYET